MTGDDAHFFSPLADQWVNGALHLAPLIGGRQMVSLVRGNAKHVGIVVLRFHDVPIEEWNNDELYTRKRAFAMMHFLKSSCFAFHTSGGKYFLYLSGRMS